MCVGVYMCVYVCTSYIHNVRVRACARARVSTAGFRAQQVRTLTEVGLFPKLLRVRACACTCMRWPGKSAFLQSCQAQLHATWQAFSAPAVLKHILPSHCSLWFSRFATGLELVNTSTVSMYQSVVVLLQLRVITMNHQQSLVITCNY